MSKYSSRSQRSRRPSLSPYIRSRILERDGHECAYCHYEATHVDHIVPYSYGGMDDDENLVASCDICNRLANNKVFESFDLKRDFIRSRYGPYLFRRFNRFRKQMSFCPDCESVFIPNVDGASTLLCSKCYAESQKGGWSLRVMRRMVRDTNDHIAEDEPEYFLD